MDWLKEHYGWVSAASVLLFAAVAKKWGGRVVTVVKAYQAVNQKIAERESHLLHITETDLDSYKRQCQEKDAKIQALQEELIKVTRQLDTRGDINAQDRLTIRLLKERLRDNAIDFDEIEAIVRSKVRLQL